MKYLLVILLILPLSATVKLLHKGQLMCHPEVHLLPRQPKDIKSIKFEFR